MQTSAHALGNKESMQLRTSRYCGSTEKGRPNMLDLLRCVGAWFLACPSVNYVSGRTDREPAV